MAIDTGPEDPMRDEQDYRANPLYPAARSVTTFGLAPAWDAGVVLVKSLRRLWELDQLGNRQAAQRHEDGGGGEQPRS